jgi:hypothetical protein
VSSLAQRIAAPAHRPVSSTRVDELLELCRRVLGSEQPAREAAGAAAAAVSGVAARPARLAAALEACRRQLADKGQRSAGPAACVAAGSDRGASATLAAAVAAELARANSLLEERERAALALADLLGADHSEIAEAMGIEPAAVGPLLARARLALRARLRGGAELVAACAERERALALLARRQDGAELSAEQEGWLFDHLRACELCERSHAAMLEASACYRAWPPGPLD